MMELPLRLRPRTGYCGRFAPSPSGELHFGSLVAALASFLDAKANNGLWLVRVEDIDPPREKPGASESILTTLQAYGMQWDEPVLFQSEQSQLYHQVLNYLLKTKQSYCCQCTRAEIKKIGGIYQGHCQSLGLPTENNAIRLVNQKPLHQYYDRIQGDIICDQALAEEDFIIFRKDGLFAYQLAVVVDDIYQGITHIVRGCDLIEPTARQLSFYQLLGIKPATYAHVPLAVTDEGYKLSKQNKAPPIDCQQPQPTLIAALKFLGLRPPNNLAEVSVEELISWAIKHWNLNAVPKQQEIAL